MSRQLKTRQGEYRGARDGKAATGVVVDRSVFEQGTEVRRCDVGRCAHVGCARVGVCGCRGLVRGRAPAGFGRFCRKWVPISPWVLDFCAVFGEDCSLSALLTWGNAGAGWRFGQVRPAKPPRSLRVGFACVKGTCLTCASVPVGAGRKRRDCRVACVDAPSANRGTGGVRDVRGRSSPGGCAPCCVMPRPHGRSRRSNRSASSVGI